MKMVLLTTLTRKSVSAVHITARDAIMTSTLRKWHAIHVKMTTFIIMESASMITGNARMEASITIRLGFVSHVGTIAITVIKIGFSSKIKQVMMILQISVKILIQRNLLKIPTLF